MSAAAERIVEIAESFVGLGASKNQTPEQKAEYKRRVWPLDIPAHQEDFCENQFACALVARAVMREAGVKHDLLEHPYAEQYTRGLDAVTQVQKIARAKGAWHEPRNEAHPPYRGCIAIIDHPGTNNAHVLVVRSYGVDGILQSMAGGKGYKGEYYVDWEERGMGYDQKVGMWRVYEGPNHDQSARVVIGWASPEELLAP